MPIFYCELNITSLALEYIAGIDPIYKRIGSLSLRTYLFPLRPVSAWRRGGTPPARDCHRYPAPCETSTRNSTPYSESSGSFETAISRCVVCLGTGCGEHRLKECYVCRCVCGPRGLYIRDSQRRHQVSRLRRRFAFAHLGNGMFLA